MGYAKRIFNFYLESSIHVAFAVVCFTYMSFYTLETPVDWRVLAFVFFGTITGYNLVKYAPIAGLYHRSLTRHLRTIQLFSFFAFCIMVYFFFKLHWDLKLISGLLGIFTLLYVIPFYRSKNLRNFSGIKIYIVGGVWAGVTVLLPSWHEGMYMSTEIVFLFFQRFIWVIALTIPFEIRDLKYDNTDLGTIPQRLGVTKTKLLGLALLVLVVLLEGFRANLQLDYLISLVVSLIVTGILIVAVRTERSRYFTTFWVEAVPLFWCGIFLVCHYFLSS